MTTRDPGNQLLGPGQNLLGLPVEPCSCWILEAECVLQSVRITQAIR